MWRTCIAPLSAVAPAGWWSGQRLNPTNSRRPAATRSTGRPRSPQPSLPLDYAYAEGKEGRSKSAKSVGDKRRAVIRRVWIAASASSCPKRFLFLSTSSTLNLALIMKLQTACPTFDTYIHFNLHVLKWIEMEFSLIPLQSTPTYVN